MEVSELESQDVEYVEYLEDDVVDTESERIEPVPMPSQIEYVEAEQVGVGTEVLNNETLQVLEGHTIFEHNGKQYMIPEELHRSGQTIVLEDYDENEVEIVDGELVLSESSDLMDASQLYMDTGEGRQFALLREGTIEVDGDEDEEKIEVFDEAMVEDAEDYQITEVTGRNMLTGQTISLSGFLEKIRKKTGGEAEDGSVSYSPKVERCRKTYYNQGRRSTSLPNKNDYVLVPSSNRHVMVGKTKQGKQIVGKVLQVWKKVDEKSEGSRPVKKRNQKRPKILAETENSVSENESLTLDDTVTRTLSGLMELETVRRSLAQRRLSIRHVLKKSVGGKVLPGSRNVSQYIGRMHPIATPQSSFVSPTRKWKFIPEPVKGSKIDLDDSATDSQQLENSTDDEPNFGTLTDNDAIVYPTTTPPSKTPNDPNPLPVNLIVIEDETGRRRTKVTIPQQSTHCDQCSRTFRNEQQLRRHQTQHHTAETHPCEICLRTFSTPTALRRHASTHDEAWTVDANGVATEITTHQPGDLHKRYRCHVCGKTFNRHSNMLRHSEIHKPPDEKEKEKQPGYTCEICGCQYNFVSSLTRHIVNNHIKHKPHLNNQTTITIVPKSP